MNKRSSKKAPILGEPPYSLSLVTSFNFKVLCIKIDIDVLHNIILFSYLHYVFRCCDELQNISCTHTLYIETHTLLI